MNTNDFKKRFFVMAFLGFASSACTTMEPGLEEDCSNGLCDVESPESELFIPNISCALSESKVLVCDQLEFSPEVSFEDQRLMKINISTSPLVESKQFQFKRDDNLDRSYLEFNLDHLSWQEGSEIKIHISMGLLGGTSADFYALFSPTDATKRVEFVPVSIRRIGVVDRMSNVARILNFEYVGLEQNEIDNQQTVVHGDPNFFIEDRDRRAPFFGRLVVPPPSSPQQLNLHELEDSDGYQYERSLIIDEQSHIVVLDDEEARYATQDELGF